MADATLGTPGRPQSATGHTTLLSGENASLLLGKHLLGFPNERLRRLLSQKNLFLTFEGKRRATYANAYRCAYLDALSLQHEHASIPEPPLPVKASRIRASASTVSVAAAKLAFRTFNHLRNGEALYHDITSDLPRIHGCEVPRRSPEEAASILLELAREHDFTLFEFFQTDEAGHAQSFDAALEALDKLDAMLRALVASLRPQEGILITSDHGNVEDLSLRQHTTNRVPVFGFGRAAPAVLGITSLLDVYPTLVRLVLGADEA